jgi:hypothetical protein
MSTQKFLGLSIIACALFFLYLSIKERKKSDIASTYRTIFGVIMMIILGMIEIFGC